MPRRTSGGSARTGSTRRALEPASALAPRGGSPSRDVAFLLDASRQLLQSLDPADVLSGVSRSLLELVPAWRAGVLLLEDRKLRLAAGHVRGVVADLPRGRLLDPARYPEVRRAIETRQPVLVGDVSADELMSDASKEASAAGLSALYVVPLLVQDRCIGVLSLGQQPGAPPFTESERFLVEAVACLAAAALHNAQLFAETQAATRQLERKVEERTRRLEESHLRLTALTQVTAAIHSSLDLDRILEAALTGLRFVPGVDLAQVYLVDVATHEPASAFALDPRGELQRLPLPLPAGEESSRALLALDGHPVPFGAARRSLRACLMVPLVSKQGIVGAVQVASERLTSFGHEDHALLEQVAGELSLALERTQLYRAARERSAQLEVISDVGRRLTSAVALEDLHPKAAALVQKALGHSLVAVLTLTPDERELLVSGVAAADSAHEVPSRGHRLPAVGAPWSWALATGEPGPAGGQASPFARPGTTELFVPIRASGQTLGLLLVQRSGLEPFTADSIAVVKTLADQLAAALRLSGLFDDLHRGREFTERVINNLSGGLLVTDRRRIVQVVNQRGAEMLHADRWELLGKDLLEVFPSATPLFQYSPDAISRECEIELRDETRIPVGYSNAFFVDSRDRSDAVIITFRDLSDLRELQRQVRHAERLATIGTFAAGIAHEIRNPLFGISATAEILGQEFPAGSQLADLCAGMLDETKRLNRLVEHLVTYSRAPVLHVAPTDPCRLWDAVVRQCQAGIERKGANVVHACAPSGRTAELDPDQLRQVLLNLFLNALDVTSPGGRIELAVEWAPDGEWVTLSIIDEGPGIPPVQIDRVFDLFYTTKPQGSGLGLAISSKIVEDHGGTIRCASPAGRGARFEVRLPVRSEASTATPAPHGGMA